MDSDWVCSPSRLQAALTVQLLLCIVVLLGLLGVFGITFFCLDMY